MTRRLVNVFVYGVFLIISHPVHAGDYYDDMVEQALKKRHQAYSGDEYSNYVTELDLHEKYQALNPDRPVRYTDNNGARLRAILNATRVKAVLNSQFEKTKKGVKVTEISKSLGSLTSRYLAIFKKEPRAYEMEYLDSIEVTIEYTTHAIETTSFHVASYQDKRKAGNDHEDKKDHTKFMQALVELAKVSGSMVFKGLAAELRKNIENNLFSENGKNRASTLVRRLDAL